MAVLLSAAGAWILLDHAHGNRLRIRKGKVKWAVLGWLCLAFALLSFPRGYLGQKVIGRLVMPAGLVWAALLLRLLWCWRRRQWSEVRLWGLVWVLYWMAGCPWVGQLGFHALERPYRDLEPLKGPPLAAVAVLGGGTAPVRGPRIGAAGDRVVLAAQLVEAGRTRVLVTTGSSIPGWGPGRDLSRETEAVWRSLGVTAVEIVRLPTPKNTSEEIAALKRFVDERGLDEIGLVTSAWHLPRAMALAQRVGLPVVPLPSDIRGPPSVDVLEVGLLDLLPAGEGHDAVHRVAWELLGRAVGR
jgi:uncharacterized SAM-binding protein YcdF (DUF218 family)